MFRLNESFFDELPDRPEIRRRLVGAAQQVARRARVHRIMPRKSAQLVVDTSGQDVRLVNTDHGGHLDEFGSAKSRPYAPLRTAVRAAGLRLDEHGK